MSVLSFIRKLFARPSKSRRLDYALGFGLTKVAARTELTVSDLPDVAFRPERLVIPTDVARHFQVVDVKVGEQRLITPIGSLPAIMFTENSWCVRLAGDVASPGDFVSVKVLNESDDEQVFQCGMYGPVA